MPTKLIYTAQSKHYFYCRDAVCEFVFTQGAVPLNPFRAFDYFLGDRVSRDQVRDANRRLILASDEVWVFGDTLADGVLVELAQASHQRMPVRFFTIDAHVAGIKEISATGISFESEVGNITGLLENEMRMRVSHGRADELVQAMGRFNEVSGNS